MTRRGSVSARSAASSTTHTPRSTSGMNDIGLKRALAVGEEAAFLWVSRSAVARSSAVTFDVLARLDERISKRVFKLSERSVLADRFLQHEHEAFKSGLTFVTAVVALRSGMTTVFEELVTRLESDAELLSPLASAMAWLDDAEVCEYVKRLQAAPSATVQQLGLMAAAAHRLDPTLDRALDADDPALRARALETAGRLGMRDLQPRLRIALEDEDATCRFWAAWSAVRLGDRAGISVLGRFAAQSGPFASPACDIALRALGAAEAVRAHARLMSMTGDERLGIFAAGIIGDPSLANWLFDAMASASLARPAGAAFCLMTGCDLRRDDLDGERRGDATPPEVVITTSSEKVVVASPATPHADAESLADEVDDELPWPDTARVRKWWDERRHAFATGVRYLAGVPIRWEGLVNVVRVGNQRQRAAAALELALLTTDAPMLDVMAPGHRQIVALDRFS